MKYIEEQQKLMRNAQKEEEDAKLREFNLRNENQEKTLENDKLKNELQLIEGQKKRVLELENEVAAFASTKQEIDLLK